MKRCWIHIGMHKTGSTSIQVSLAKERDLADWKYIKVEGRRNMGGVLYAMFASDPTRYHWFQKQGRTSADIVAEGARLREELGREIQKSPESNLVISGESLTLIDEKGLVEMDAFLRNFFDEIRVIGYVRPPIGFKVSFFQQRVKHSNCDFDFNDFQLQYRKRFKKFDDIFGRENVLLRKFEPETFRNGCIVMDFCDQIGMAAPDASEIERINESLCREACGILYAYRKFGPSYGVGKDVIKENKRLLAPLLKMQGSKFIVASSLVKKSIQSEYKDHKWMEKRLGVSLGESRSVDRAAVASEEGLLEIRQDSVLQFIQIFEHLYQVQIPDQKRPTGDPVNPREVADLLTCCLGLCRTSILCERLRKHLRRTHGPRKSGFLVSCLRCMGKLRGRKVGPVPRREIVSDSS
jgi:hypothetical protein